MTSKKTCPKCGKDLVGTGHKLFEIFGIKGLACPGMPLGEFEFVDKQVESR